MEKFISMLPSTGRTRPASSSEDSSDGVTRPEIIRIDYNNNTHSASLNTTSIVQFTSSDECSDSDIEGEGASSNTQQTFQDTPSTTSNISAASSLSTENPWPQIANFFLYLDKKACGKSIYFQCLLCRPKFKKLSTSVTSTNNLKKHVSCVHPHHLKKLQDCIDSAKKQKKRTFSNINVEDAGEGCSSKRRNTFFECANPHRSLVTQEMYEVKVSSFYSLKLAV